MSLLRTLCVALFAVLAQVSAASAACTPTTTPNTAGVTSNSQLELLQEICNNQTGSASAVAPVKSTTAEACRVLKSSAGALLDLTTTIGATSGWVLVFDATAAPSDGAVAPIWWHPVNSNGTFGGINKAWPSGGPLRGATGITVCFSTTGPFTKTASSTGVAHSAQVQ